LSGIREIDSTSGRIGEKRTGIRAGKKTVQIVIEQDGEIRRILKKVAESKHADLEAWETALRAAVLSAGAKVLEQVLQGIGSGREPRVIVCECGVRMESQGLKHKEVLTILGPVTYRRSLFQCPVCQNTRYPGDEELDIVETTRSPGLRRMMARAGSRSTFKEGRDDLKIYAGIEVSAKDVKRVVEGMGNRWKPGRFKNERRSYEIINGYDLKRPFLFTSFC
jgi:hypothetical protein